MADSTIKSYFSRNTQKVLQKYNASLGKLAQVDEVAMANLSADLQSVINGKADAATTLAGYGITDGMTATEIAEAISKAVAGADHLRRKTVASVDAIDVTADDADKYIYMVANAGKKNSAGSNKYDEYVVIEGAVEHVGDWEVDLSDYAKTEAVTTAIAEALKAYSTTEDMNTAITTALTGYIKLTDLSAETTGDGNVVTSIEYDSATGKISAKKGNTAILDSDLVDLTDEECDTIVANAKATTQA